MKYNVGDEVYIKGKVISIATNNPYDPNPLLFYQIDIGETGNIMVSENKVVDITKLVKPAKTIETKKISEGHYR